MAHFVVRCGVVHFFPFVYTTAVRYSAYEPRTGLFDLLEYLPNYLWFISSTSIQVYFSVVVDNTVEVEIASTVAYMLAATADYVVSACNYRWRVY